MRLLTVNLRHGGGVRLPRLVPAILALEPDVAVLTEYREGIVGAMLRQLLSDAGYTTFQHENLIPRTNSVLIASRLPAALSLQGDTHRLVTCEVGALTIVGLYLPLNATKVAFWDEYFATVGETFIKRDAILIGDFNTGLRTDRQVLAKFAAEDRFQALGDAGWVNAWRQHHPSEQEFSWFSHRGNGFLIDHAFLSPGAARRLLRADLHHEFRTEHLTDHSALTIDLRPYRVGRSDLRSRD